MEEIWRGGGNPMTTHPLGSCFIFYSSPSVVSLRNYGTGSYRPSISRNWLRYCTSSYQKTNPSFSSLPLSCHPSLFLSLEQNKCLGKNSSLSRSSPSLAKMTRGNFVLKAQDRQDSISLVRYLHHSWNTTSNQC